jgi:multidrug efflux pump subunit AcrB
LKNIPLRSAKESVVTSLDSVVSIKRTEAPTEVDHYRLRRIIDIYVMPSGEDLSRIASAMCESHG